MNVARLFRFAGVSLLLAAAVPARAEPASRDTNDPWLQQLTLLLSDHFQPDGRLELAWSQPERAPRAPDALLELLAPPTRLAAQLIVRVQAIFPDGSVQSHGLLVAARLWRDGWTLREPGELRRPVREAALLPMSYDALRERDVLEWDAQSELDFARNLPAGRLLTWRDVVRRPLVRRNEAVEVLASDGGLTVTLRAIALHDAVRGEAVRVRNPDSRKEFTAIVTEPSRAVVKF